MQLLARVRRTVLERALLARGDRVLLAVSGGPDSAAMLDVLHRLSGELALSLVVASIDHGLRPEAARELELVRAMSEARSLPFVSVRVELARVASIQAEARRARYAALHEVAAREGARRIAVGHTRDDQAETVLARLLRGASVKGLSGIAPRRADGVVRPLIDARRADVEAWLAGHGIACARDPSNRDDRYLRARIRHALLPALREEDPALVDHLAALADDARAMARLARARGAALERRARAEDDPGALRAEILSRAPEAARREALARWIARFASRLPSRTHLLAVERALDGRGEVRLPGNLVARVEDGLLRATFPRPMKKDERRGGNGHDR